MLIAPALKMCWRKDHKDTSAEDSKKSKCHILFCQGGFITIGIWLLHVFDVALDIHYFINADVQRLEIKYGLLGCIILPFIVIPYMVCCCVPAKKEGGEFKICMMFLCNCFVITDKFSPENETEKTSSHNIVLFVRIFFSLIQNIPQMILQTWNNFLVGTTLSWSEILSPMTSYISTVSTFSGVIFLIYSRCIF
jgi:hypothetical protein